MTAFWAAVAGALAGAIASSYFAYIIQRRSFNEDREIRKEELRKTQQVLGRNLILKAARIHSNILTIHRYLEEAFQIGEQHAAAIEPWGFVRELAPLPSPVRFSDDELSMLMGLEDDGVFNSVLNIEPVHESMVELMKKYHSDRRELLVKLPISDVQETVASTDLHPVHAESLRLQINAVNNLIEQLRAHAERGFCESRIALHDLCKLLQDKLKIKHGIEFSE